MDTASWLSAMNLVLLAAGIAVGVAAGYYFSPAIGEAKRLRSELDDLRGEHDKYKASVNSHFRKTADLVGEMTKSYAAVYDHLAGGARRFCDEAGAGSQLPFGPSPGQLASPVIETDSDSPEGESQRLRRGLVRGNAVRGRSPDASRRRAGRRIRRG